MVRKECPNCGARLEYGESPCPICGIDVETERREKASERIPQIRGIIATLKKERRELEEERKNSKKLKRNCQKKRMPWQERN
jgi:uncharacterized Zn finger protein (UPF0148 family)